MQRALERPDSPHDGRDDVRAGRDDDPGREGGGVHAVVRHGVEVRLERPDLLRARLFSGEHVEVVGRVTQPRVGRHRFLSSQQPPVRGHDGWQARHQGERLGVGIAGHTKANRARRHAQRVHRRHPSAAAARSSSSVAPGSVRSAPSSTSKTASSPGSGNASPQQVDDLLEASPARQLLDEPGDDELASLTIHRAQTGLGRDHTLQPGCENRSRIVLHGSFFL